MVLAVRRSFLMDLKQLESFVRVAELGSFTRAAIELRIAQPALSRQVRQLEVELHQHLLKRNGRGAVVTEAGQLLLQHARGILHQVERAREAMGQAQGALAGRVALGLPPSVARSLTVPLVHAFRERMPAASLSISEDLSVGMREDLLQGRLDLAVLYNPGFSPDIALTPLVEQALFLVEPCAGPRARRSAPLVPLGEIAEHPLVMPRRPNAIRMLIESELARLGKKPQVVLEIDGVGAILDLVADGAGCAILSRDAVDKSARPSAYVLRPINRPALRIPVMLAHSVHRPQSATQQLAASLVRETLVRLNGGARPAAGTKAGGRSG